MPLLHKVQSRDGRGVELILDQKRQNQWVTLSQEDTLPADASFSVVSLTRYLELTKNPEMTKHNSGPALDTTIGLPKGVIVAPADDVSLIEPFVEHLSLICIDFPVYTDGRGYSHARLLRKRMAYRGELRAIGDVREDQTLFMIRTGIDSYQFNEMPDLALLSTLNSRYTQNYQPSYPLETRAELTDTRQLP